MPIGELGNVKPEKNLSDEVLRALEEQRIKSLPPEEQPERSRFPQPKCDIVVYGGKADEMAGMLLPKALRVNGEVVYTPVGTVYETRGGGTEPLMLQLTLLPTSLSFLPGDPPDKQEDTTEGEKLP